LCSSRASCWWMMDRTCCSTRSCST
jgi:hypothetical protein